ncbi:MAG: response regulator transcription factor [Bacteroidales bacterium]
MESTKKSNRNKPLVVLIADDHLIVRQGVQLIVKELFKEVQILHAASLNQLMGMVLIHHIDLIILDVEFPDGLALSVVPKIRERDNNIKILIFTSYQEELYSLKFIEAGADGFLSKMGSENEIKAAILELVEGRSYLSPLTTALVGYAKHNPNLSNPLTLLTTREFEIALLLAKGVGNLEIANKLSLKQNTVSTFKRRIFEKLQIESVVELIKIVSIHHPT